MTSRVRALLVAVGLAAAAVAVAGVPGDAIAQPQPSRRAWLGVELDKGPSGGVVARHVVTTSPAAKAGVADGDLILSADGQAIDEPRQLVARVALLGPDSAIKLKIKHQGVERAVTANLVAFPGLDQILRLDKIGTFAPQWKQLVPVSGKVPQALGELRGKVVVVDFWASWCGPCRMVAPQLSKWQQRFGAQGLTVVGLTSDSVPAATRAAQALDMRYAVASDPEDQTAATYGVRALPTMFILDKKGVIREIEVGFDPSRAREVEALIQALLAEPAP